MLTSISRTLLGLLFLLVDLCFNLFCSNSYPMETPEQQRSLLRPLRSPKRQVGLWNLQNEEGSNYDFIERATKIRESSSVQ